MVTIDWSVLLKCRFKDATGIDRKVRFPAGQDIKIEGDIDNVRIWLSREAVTANMQGDSAAFEAWALVLKSWCGVKNVEIDWESPPAGSNNSDSKACHYRRFLYRLHHFKDMFYDWFSIVPDAAMSEASFLKSDKLVLNIAGSKSSQAASNDNSEAALEWRIVRSDKFKKKFELEHLERQLPVGLFDEIVSDKSRVFGGKKSAIDLFGTDLERQLWIFELKQSKNIGMGVVSELFFYAFLVRDVLRERIMMPDGPSLRFSGGVRRAIINCKSVKACFLAPKFHPLLCGGKILDLLNSATAKMDWPVSFQMIKISDSGDEIKSEFNECVR